MIAVDSTVLADWLFNGDPMRKAAIHLQGLDGEWCCLALARYELGNVAWKLARAGFLAVNDLEMGWAALGKAGIEFVEEVEWCEVSALAQAKEITFYDASYVWLARLREMKLRTRDKDILRICPDVAIPMP